MRGKIDIVTGDAGRIVVAGTVTVRVGWDVPADAEALARQVAAAPPIEQAGNTVRLRIPSDRTAQRAVTVSYQVRVPPETVVQATTESGATTVRGVSGRVTVRTQSGAIDLGSLAGVVEVTTGSGTVAADDVGGPLAVTTDSSGFTGRALGSSLRVRTKSGAVDASLAGAGDVDIETGSSAIRLQGIRGALTATTQSGAITVQGTPSGAWSATTGSSSVGLTIGAVPNFRIDAVSRSGNVNVEGAAVSGDVSKHRVSGTVGAGGPLIQVSTGSGAIRVDVRR